MPHSTGFTASSQSRPFAEVVGIAQSQYAEMLRALRRHDRYPRTWVEKKLVLAGAADWTSGFFPGTLWYLFEATGEPRWREVAEAFTAGLEAMKHNRRTHDVGFMLNCSFGNGYRLTRNPAYREILLTGATVLADRFDPKVGCIKSWDTRVEWPYPVIIDNMMNLELLLWASRESGDPRYRAIAESHADTTLRNHFRPDASSYHVVDYDPATGSPRSRQTHQGAADESAWARGQSWAVYGYSVMYRETRKQSYLDQAMRVAAFIMNHPRLPEDKIPFWDFDAPRQPKAPRDASAAAISSSALFELATFLPEPEAAPLRSFADQQLASLSSPAYLASAGDNGGFLLMHSTGSFPRQSEIDVPLNYADYYYLEALLRRQQRTSSGPS